MERDGIKTNDRQLACARISSPEGQAYLAGMSAAANYAWVNRSAMTFLARQAFAKIFNNSPEALDMHVVYDVSHNIAKIEEHLVDGELKRLLVHRKGSTRAFPPHHPLIPVDYQVGLSAPPRTHTDGLSGRLCSLLRVGSLCLLSRTASLPGTFDLEQPPTLEVGGRFPRSGWSGKGGGVEVEVRRWCEGWGGGGGWSRVAVGGWGGGWRCGGSM